MASNQYPPVVSYDLTATISNGQTASGVIDLNGNTLCGIFIPAGFTGNSLSFQAATTATGTFVPVLSGGSSYSLSGGAGNYVPVESIPVLGGLRFIQIIAGSSQVSSTTLTLAVRPL